VKTRFDDLTDEHLAGVAALLEARHARLCAVEPLTVEDDPRAAIRSLLSDGMSGYVALRGDDVVGS
jgi:hypothetical protein